MGKRLRRGGGSGRLAVPPSSVMHRSILLRRIKTLTLTLNSSPDPDPDLLIQRLRDHYPDYARFKLQPFSARLRQVLQHLRNTSTKLPAAGDTSPSSFSDAGMPSRRKRGKDDVLEERLLRAESEHLRRFQTNHVASSESADDSTSTSDDAAFEENMEPVFGVTKSMQSEQSARKGIEEKNVEIGMKKGGGSGKEIPVVVGSDRGSNELSWAAGREGPWVRDLGGMSKVLEDLKMEVIVPLCHPELPKRLGVRPMAGILLHGPPGCGKTKLAYAIAHEAGVPFYKISATEVVSSVSGASEENIRDLFNKAY